MPRSVREFRSTSTVVQPREHTVVSRWRNTTEYGGAKLGIPGTRMLLGIACDLSAPTRHINPLTLDYKTRNIRRFVCWSREKKAPKSPSHATCSTPSSHRGASRPSRVQCLCLGASSRATKSLERSTMTTSQGRFTCPPLGLLAARLPGGDEGLSYIL